MRYHQRHWAIWVGVFLGLCTVSIEGAENINMKASEPGIYCRLTSAEMRARLEVIRAEFLVHVKGVEELDNGYRYWFEKTPERIQSDFPHTFSKFEITL